MAYIPGGVIPPSDRVSTIVFWTFIALMIFSVLGVIFKYYESKENKRPPVAVQDCRP
jgi:hypothetical protein